MNSDRINLGRRKQEGTPECQINLRNRKAAAKLALMTCGADEDTAKKIVLAIVAGEIPAVSLKF